MGKILPSFQKNLIEELIDNISSNTSQYYVIASNPVPYGNSTPTLTNDDYKSKFEFNWKMLFGKRLANTDCCPVIENNIWTTNTAYDKYDNTSNTLYSNNNYYVVAPPALVGGVYNIYKCLDNANNSKSNTNPGNIGTPTQPAPFTTADGYKWKYITTISNSLYVKFSTEEYIPVVANSLIVDNASDYSGVDTVVITNSGNGYQAYTNGTVQSVVNSGLIQISNTSSTENYFYNNNSIYIYNTSLGSAQLLNIIAYISNSTGKWVYFDSAANTSIIFPSQSEYIISPQVVFDTDGDIAPKAYSTVNTFSNTIHTIELLEAGTNITRANVWIESSYGSGANLYAIVPPPGGHGFSPTTELNVKGVALSFSFSNTESNTIVTSNVNYNKIALIKNPYALSNTGTKSSRYYTNTFNQCTKVSLSPNTAFQLGEEVIGATSNSKGIIAYSNSSHAFIVGDKTFSNGEIIGNTTSASLTTITISTLGDIYAKDLNPFYIQNINNINRSNTQNERFKIILQV